MNADIYIYELNADIYIYKFVYKINITQLSNQEGSLY